MSLLSVLGSLQTKFFFLMFILFWDFNGKHYRSSHSIFNSSYSFFYISILCLFVFFLGSILWPISQSCLLIHNVPFNSFTEFTIPAIFFSLVEFLFVWLQHFYFPQITPYAKNVIHWWLSMVLLGNFYIHKISKPSLDSLNENLHFIEVHR